MLTITQLNTLNFINNEIESRGLPPTRQEIADEFSIHPSAAQGRLEALQKKGFIELIPAIARGIRVT